MKKYLFMAGSGRGIGLELTRDQVMAGSHSGSCDADIADLRKVPEIAEQLAKLDPADLAEELAEYTDWDCSDHEANLDRILWIACGDIREENKKEF